MRRTQLEKDRPRQPIAGCFKGSLIITGLNQLISNTSGPARPSVYCTFFSRKALRACHPPVRLDVAAIMDLRRLFLGVAGQLPAVIPGCSSPAALSDAAGAKSLIMLSFTRGGMSAPDFRLREARRPSQPSPAGPPRQSTRKEISV
jgi:hypothetical protein